MDMDAFRTEMRGEFAQLRGDFAELRGVARTRTVVFANLGSMIGVAALVLAAVWADDRGPRRSG